MPNTVLVTLPDEVHCWLEDEAERHGMTFKALATAILATWVEAQQQSRYVADVAPVAPADVTGTTGGPSGTARPRHRTRAKKRRRH